MTCSKVRRKQYGMSSHCVKRIYALESLLLLLVASSATTPAISSTAYALHTDNPDVIVFTNASSAITNVPIINTTDSTEKEVGDFDTTITLTTSTITVVNATEASVALNATNSTTVFASRNTTIPTITNSAKNVTSTGNHTIIVTSDSTIPTNATKPDENGTSINTTIDNNEATTDSATNSTTASFSSNTTILTISNSARNSTSSGNPSTIVRSNPINSTSTIKPTGNDTATKNITKENDIITENTTYDKTSYASTATESSTIAGTTPMPTAGPWYPDAPYPLAACQRLLASNVPPMANVTWRSGGAEDASVWATFNRTSPQGRRLVSSLRFYALATVEETLEWTALCVGASVLASHSYEDGGSTPAVSIEVQPRWDVAVGIVRLRSRCLRQLERLSEPCSPSFIPLQYFLNLPLFHNSPLEEILWILFFSDSIGMNLWAINSINITTNQGSIPSNWINKISLPFLKYLHITGNDWNESSITLGNLPQLIHLNLCDNNLHLLPEEFFSNMTNLEAVILDHNHIRKCPSSINQLRNLSMLDLSNNKGNSILKFTEDDLNNLPKSLRMLELSHTNLEMNLGEYLFLPELRYLNISGCDINISNKQESVDSGRLMILDISSNHLIAIPSDYFSAMSSLEILIMNKNKFYFIPDLPIENILTNLYAAHNLYIFLAQNTTVNLQKLEILDLSWCMIERIFQPIFSNAYSLKQINLSHNFLKYIPSCLFCLLYNLKEVDLSHNYIQTVYLWQLNLRKLDFSSNGLVDFSANMSTIENLDLSFNIVQNFDLVSSSVQKLNFSHNSISYISPELWGSMSETLKVDLGGNDFVCCLFRDTCYLNKKQDTEIQNLGTLEPLKCSINANSSKIPFSMFTYDTYCSNREPILLSVIVITFVAVLMFAAIFAAFALHVLQLRRRKLIIQHPTNSRETNA